MDLSTYCLAADSLRYQLRSLNSKVLLMQLRIDFEETSSVDKIEISTKLNKLINKYHLLLAVVQMNQENILEESTVKRFIIPKIKNALCDMLKMMYTGEKYPALRYCSWLTKTNKIMKSEEKFEKYRRSINKGNYLETFMYCGTVHGGGTNIYELVAMIKKDIDLCTVVLDRLERYH